MDSITIWASNQAIRLIGSLGNRWLHVQSVVKQAHRVSQVFDENEGTYLIAVAYLHDIGYAPELKRTGFHPIDGANYLRSQGYERLASLVAHHSEAQCEAQLRGLESELAQFPREHSPLAKALNYCDMTTGPQGQRVSFEERIADILSRYGETDIVAQAIHRATPQLRQAVEHTQELLRSHNL
ncbi:metal-dependent phosphohydrolase, HD subdomain protein [Ktedonobacter sp. SOSP1-52]|uniref:HD domain-containing protein n=1 Tax=Ktedonobacter sp. SOSP1-52 TaxID=2778366 RepID=UPI0019166F9D|nr:HD domain-containing protein [Ktedonobacter sp. SOSP1-52]GHO69132.1 metal-dependent phosphohydrolase, HD subdomain protein [Ktedonobacter sp. SOSP1-52]